MKYTHDKGITLIALVVTIIVLLILAGVSILAIVGENGLIARAKEAIMLTQLADILFDVENDLLDIKADFIKEKLPTTDVINKLMIRHNEKYNIYSILNFANGIADIVLTLPNQPISTLKIGFTGDVYVDNYKRGKIQISDIYEEIFVEGCLCGDAKIKVNDGTIKKNESTGMYEIKYLYKNENVPWINSNNEIIAWTDNFGIYPTGLKDHEFAAYNIGLVDEALDMLNGKYVILPSAYCKQNGNELKVEQTLFHFYTNTLIPVGNILEAPTNPDKETTKSLLVGGTYITEVGIILSDNPELTEPNVRYYLPDDTPDAFYYDDEKTAATKTYLYNCKELQESLDKAGIKSSRVYYAPYVNYRLFSEEKINETTGEKEYHYNDQVFSYLGNTVKFFDLEK